MHRSSLSLAAAALVASTTAIAPGPARAQEYYRPLPDSFYRGPRLRFDVEGELGGTTGDESGLGGGVTLGVGLQVNDVIGAFVQHRLFLADQLEMGGHVFAHSYNSFVVDLTVFENVQVGVGPSLDVGIGALCDREGGDALGDCHDLNGLYVGLDARFAVVLGDRSLARRRGLVIAAHVHPTWLDRDHSVLTLTIGAGFTLY